MITMQWRYVVCIPNVLCAAWCENFREVIVGPTIIVQISTKASKHKTVPEPYNRMGYKICTLKSYRKEKQEKDKVKIPVSEWGIRDINTLRWELFPPYDKTFSMYGARVPVCLTFDYGSLVAFMLSQRRILRIEYEDWDIFIRLFTAS